MTHLVLDTNVLVSGQTPAPELILAPIRGITDAVYRRVFAGCFGGFDRAVAPFVQVPQGQSLRPGEQRQLTAAANPVLRTIPQLLSTHPPTLLDILGELRGLGHTEVNWNLGCPAPMVAGRGRGAGLLPHPDRIAAVLEQVLPKSPVRLSVKMRLGNRNPDEFPAVLEVL
ncbi:MAG: tRNA-dihydrouridine synthase, partial [Lentisphaeria bacterium]